MDKIEVYFKDGRIYFEGLVERSCLAEGMGGFILVLENYDRHKGQQKTGSRYIVMMNMVYNEELRAYELSKKYVETGVKVSIRKVVFEREKGDINSDRAEIDLRYAYGYDRRRYKRKYAIIGMELESKKVAGE